jgi:hypothetical protein
MRSDRESIVIVVWVVLAACVAVVSLYDAIGSGGWLIHIVVLVAVELVLAGVMKLVLRAVGPR